MAASTQPNVPIAVFTSPPASVTPYQGKNRLATTIAAPATARRSCAVRVLRSGSIELSPAPIAGLEIVPVLDRVLAELPAQVDLLAVADRREVDQTAVDVPHHDPGLLERAEQAAHLEEGLAALAAGLPASVSGCRLRERLVRLGVGQLILRVTQPPKHRLDGRKQRVRLLDRVVALVDSASLAARALTRFGHGAILRLAGDRGAGSNYVPISATSPTLQIARQRIQAEPAVPRVLPGALPSARRTLAAGAIALAVTISWLAAVSLRVRGGGGAVGAASAPPGRT